MLMILGIILFLAVVFVFFCIQEKLNTKKAATGEDKKKVEDILRRNVPDPENYTLAYACWEKKKHLGKTVETSYWYYAVAFNSDRIYLIPLKDSGNGLTAGAVSCIQKSSLGMVNSEEGSNWMTLYDGNREELVTLRVKKENLKDDSYHIVNIIQPEAEEAFKKLAAQWLEDVNKVNGVTVTGMYGNPLMD